MSKFVHGKLDTDLKAVAVIMAGGVGTRFWPLSRKAKPKQYLPLADKEQSLIQATAARLEPLVGKGGILVVTSASQVELVKKQLPNACILAEPSARNTAACVGVASQFVLETVGDIPTLCLPADHVIQGDEEIRGVYEVASKLCIENDCLVTVGIKPDRAETGYGYIQRGALVDTESPVYKVEKFVEKPNIETAQHYLKSGEFYWNSGMFAWRPSVILAEIEKQLPAMAASLKEISKSFDADIEAVSEKYNSLESVSIDVGVMEQAASVMMLSGDSFGWSDVGSWHSWVETASATEADANGNILRGDVIAIESSNSAVLSSSKLFAVVGLDNVVVVETEDSVLVCHRDKAQHVKEVVETLKKTKRDRYL